MKRANIVSWYASCFASFQAVFCSLRLKEEVKKGVYQPIRLFTSNRIGSGANTDEKNIFRCRANRSSVPWIWDGPLEGSITHPDQPNVQSISPILLMILSDIVFAAVAFWLTQQTQVTHLPAGIAAILLIAGLAVVCIPLLSRMSCSGSAQFFVSWMPVHRSIAGAFLFIMGLVALIWKSKPATG
jgi:hypothetical protein